MKPFVFFSLWRFIQCVLYLFCHVPVKILALLASPPTVIVTLLIYITTAVFAVQTAAAIFVFCKWAKKSKMVKKLIENPNGKAMQNCAKSASGIRLYACVGVFQFSVLHHPDQCCWCYSQLWDYCLKQRHLCLLHCTVSRGTSSNSAVSMHNQYPMAPALHWSSFKWYGWSISTRCSRAQPSRDEDAQRNEQSIKAN